MNKRQLITMWAGICIIVLITLFPPTLQISLKEGDESFGGISFETLRAKVYYEFQEVVRPAFVFSAITGTTENKIQYAKMFLCHFVIALITIGLIVTFNEMKAK